MFSFFSSDDYLSSLAEIYFKHASYSIEYFEIEGRVYRLLVLERKKIITDFPFLDFISPVEKHNNNVVRKLLYLPKTICDEKVYQSEAGVAKVNDSTYKLAPFILLSSFKNWSRFIEFLDRRNHKLLSDTVRRFRKLTQEMGKINFVFNDASAGIIDTCILWKSTQYDKIGGTDMFLDTRHKDFFLSLQKKKVLVISSCYVNNTPIAVHIGVLYKNAYYLWVSAYDQSFSAFAPGRLLLHFIMEECFKKNVKVFHFMLGAESYKWQYATHYHTVGPVGKPTIYNSIQILLCRLQIIFRRKYPAIYYRLKNLFILSQKIFVKK